MSRIQGDAVRSAILTDPRVLKMPVDTDKRFKQVRQARPHPVLAVRVRCVSFAPGTDGAKLYPCGLTSSLGITLLPGEAGTRNSHARPQRLRPGRNPGRGLPQPLLRQWASQELTFVAIRGDFAAADLSAARMALLDESWYLIDIVSLMVAASVIFALDPPWPMPCSQPGSVHVCSLDWLRCQTKAPTDRSGHSNARLARNTTKRPSSIFCPSSGREPSL